MPVITQIPNKFGITWDFVTPTYVLYDAKNYIAKVGVDLYESPEAFQADRGNFAPIPFMGFDLCLDADYPFQMLRKQRPGLRIVEQHSDPVLPDEITPEELTGLRGNFEGYILTLPELMEFYTNSDISVNKFLVRYLTDQFGIQPDHMTVI